MKKKVLVFPCGSEIGLEIYRSLQDAAHVELWGGSTMDDHGKFVYKNYIPGIPFVNDGQFIEQLNDVIQQHKFDFIFPAHDSVILKLAENINNLACPAIGCTNLQVAQVCRSKKLTYSFFKDVLNTPKVFDTVEEVTQYPVFLKPDVGQGSKGTYKVASKEEIDFYLAKDSSLMILEYLPFEEYTVDCFTNYKGELIFSRGRIRQRTMNGISVNTKPIEDGTFTSIAQLINSKMVMRGVWFFQVKKNSTGEYALLEIAPRIAGAMAMHRNIGVNFALMSVFDACNIDVAIIKNSFDIEMDRALSNSFKTSLDYNAVYVDLDDCLIIDNAINTRLIKFLYQCINNGKQLYLVTRHKFNPHDTLAKYRLQYLFDGVHHLTEVLRNKAQYITTQKAIFIDDSFAERKQVAEALHIPVFAPDAIECLLED